MRLNIMYEHCSIAPSNEVTQTGSTTTLVIRNPQPSDAGVYQCVFNDTAGYVLRSTTLLIDGKLLILHT